MTAQISPTPARSGLSVQDLRVALGGRVILDGISLSLQPGQITVIVGANGAGKSTLASTLAGLLKPASGQALLDEHPLLGLHPRERARRIAFLPQTPEIAWPITVKTLVGLGRTPFIGSTGPGLADEAAIVRAMETTGIADLSERLVPTLSGGERARVLMARALAGEPEWLIADEPLTGLDPAHQLDAADLLRTLTRDGPGVILTLHDLTLALRLADRVIVLAGGAIVGDGRPVEALAPEILGRVFGITARIEETSAGLLVDVHSRN